MIFKFSKILIWVSKHLHEDFKSTSNLKSSYSSAYFLKVPHTGVQEMKTGEIDIFHFIEINHTFFDFLVPSHPGLLLVF